MSELSSVPPLSHPSIEKFLVQDISFLLRRSRAPRLEPRPNSPHPFFTMAQLPDPTVDLDWSGYVGSIQEHFRAQAEAHPERTCVVETRSSTTPERSFTYRQIYEASNTLAWYLNKAGVTNGDVVMIWAHRSVDLVVALMGILVPPPTIPSPTRHHGFQP